MKRFTRTWPSGSKEAAGSRSGTRIIWHEDSKGKRDEIAPLHPVVVEHLHKIVDFGPMVFPWPHHERTVCVEFTRIQHAAKNETAERIIDLPCREKHEHADACHVYGFHDLRRAFATQNALRLTENALQALMRHKSDLTTKRYINMARQSWTGPSNNSTCRSV